MTARIGETVANDLLIVRFPANQRMEMALFSSWKVNLCPSLESLTEWNRFSTGTALYLNLSIPDQFPIPCWWKSIPKHKSVNTYYMQGSVVNVIVQKVKSLDFSSTKLPLLFYCERPLTFFSPGLLYPWLAPASSKVCDNKGFLSIQYLNNKWWCLSLVFRPSIAFSQGLCSVRNLNGSNFPLNNMQTSKLVRYRKSGWLEISPETFWWLDFCW